MANRFVLPLETPVDATGAPYPGGKLFFYQSGPSTKLDTYSDEGLTIANSNPVVLDSAGRYPNAIFLQDLAYKVVLAPSTDSDPPTAPIWTQDPVYTSDYSTIAQVQGVNGSPNGQLAGTAASATIPASMAWDYVNNILYICTTSGTTSTAAWTAINASSAAAVVTAPQGYLTPVSGTPVISTDSVAATAIYYTPFRGLLVPLYNGTTMVPVSIVTELQLTLTSSHVASNIYDCYIFLLNGVPTLGTGPSWSAGTSGSITAGSCARGTGSGGAALSVVQGFYTNAVSMTMRYGNGTTTTTVNANQGTYVGSIFMDSTNGQVSCYRTAGQSRKWGVWNAYNQQPLNLLVTDSTSSWNYTINTARPANNSTANSFTSFAGLPSTVTAACLQNLQVAGAAAGNSNGIIGVGYNSTTAFSGAVGSAFIGSGSAVTSGVSLVGSYNLAPAIGINTFTALEQSIVAGGGNVTYYGGSSMRFTGAFFG